jgi:hypothetical protein
VDLDSPQRIDEGERIQQCKCAFGCSRFLCKMEPKQDAYRRDVIEQTQGVYPATAQIKRYQEVEISVNSVGANVQGWGDDQAMTLSIVPSA